MDKIEGAGARVHSGSKGPECMRRGGVVLLWGDGLTRPLQLVKL
jgi:hypothetical protein